MTTAETHSLGEHKALLRADFASFAAHCFRELNPRTPFAPSWHHEFVAAKLAAVRDGQLFATRLSAQRQAVSEFNTTAQGCRLATSVGGVLTGRGADIIIIDDPLKP